MSSPPSIMPPLHGLVLAGGQGTRLGKDKGELDYHGLPQARWALELAAPFCERVFVSVRAAQAHRAAYRDLPLILDAGAGSGPAAGLVAAWHEHPGVAWLVLAADMPLVDAELLERLLAARDASVLATAFRDADGGPEPLCAIYEPATLAVIGRAASADAVSLRRILIDGPARLVAAADSARLMSVNTPDDDERVRRFMSKANHLSDAGHGNR